MASTSGGSGLQCAEYCTSCDRETHHVVDIQVREESSDPQTAAFSREPYRVATCTRCGAERAKRMNDV